MNTNTAKTILCYGDSNTYGLRPDGIRARWPANVRWPGVLQGLLGAQYYVIEEGLPGRTASVNSLTPKLDGNLYFEPCLESHNPIDTVIIMLGTNDTKTIYELTATDIAAAVEALVNKVGRCAKTDTDAATKIILVSPPHIRPEADLFKGKYSDNFGDLSIAAAAQLAPALLNVSKKQDCLFVNAATVATTGADGIHLDKNAHYAIAELVKDTIN